MSFTAEELDTFVNSLDWDETIENHRESISGESHWMDLWYGEVKSLDTPYGTIEKEKAWGGEGDGASIFLVVRVGDRLFQKSGYYSSWDSSRLDGPLIEVEAYTEPVIRYRRKS